jgi:acyl-CoA reductase-like NAD-dependent aldehyde dehydrogenase
VQPGSFTHLTEFFGPVLGVMKADDLAHAIRLVNQTGYGLTSGLESLDEREQASGAGIRAGNLYINRRATTGAIVLRQPFGGMGKSAPSAPGIKAGGRPELRRPDVSRQPVLAEGRIELLWYLTEQSISHDYHRYGNLGARTTEPRRPVD